MKNAKIIENANIVIKIKKLKFSIDKIKNGVLKWVHVNPMFLYIEFTQGFKLFHLGGPSGPLFFELSKMLVSLIDISIF